MDDFEYLPDTYRAGEIVPAGTYMRIDDGSRRAVVLETTGPLPPGFDGHVAIYLRTASRLAPSVDMSARVPAAVHAAAAHAHE